MPTDTIESYLRIFAMPLCSSDPRDDHKDGLQLLKALEQEGVCSWDDMRQVSFCRVVSMGFNGVAFYYLCRPIAYFFQTQHPTAKRTAAFSPDALRADIQRRINIFMPRPTAASPLVTRDGCDDGQYSNAHK
jgi:hypothetical protein